MKQAVNSGTGVRKGLDKSSGGNLTTMDSGL